MMIWTIVVSTYALLHNKIPKDDLAEISKFWSLILSIINDIRVYEEYYIQSALSNPDDLCE